MNRPTELSSKDKEIIQAFLDELSKLDIQKLMPEVEDILNLKVDVDFSDKYIEIVEKIDKKYEMSEKESLIKIAEKYFNVTDNL